MSRGRQLSLLYFFPLGAVIFALVTHANTLASIFLFWGLPSILITFWSPRRAIKAASFAAVLTFFLIALNIIFYTTKQWYVVSMFSNHIFGIMAWEDIPYFFFFVYFPIIFWEHFYEKQVREKNWNKKMTRLTAAFLLASLAIVGAHYWAPYLIQIPYFYFVGVVLFAAIPLAIELLARPHLKPKFFRVAIYFAYVGILYELSSLYLGQWYFPTEKMFGWIVIHNLRFPIEELFAWMILGSSAILTWYEYFDDDNR